jgi:hypothetical protein
VLLPPYRIQFFETLARCVDFVNHTLTGALQPYATARGIRCEFSRAYPCHRSGQRGDAPALGSASHVIRLHGARPRRRRPAVPPPEALTKLAVAILCSQFSRLQQYIAFSHHQRQARLMFGLYVKFRGSFVRLFPQLDIQERSC